jgi:hypothetical protein
LKQASFFEAAGAEKILAHVENQTPIVKFSLAKSVKHTVCVPMCINAASLSLKFMQK